MEDIYDLRVRLSWFVGSLVFISGLAVCVIRRSGKRKEQERRLLYQMLVMSSGPLTSDASLTKLGGRSF